MFSLQNFKSIVDIMSLLLGVSLFLLCKSVYLVDRFICTADYNIFFIPF